MLERCRQLRLLFRREGQRADMREVGDLVQVARVSGLPEESESLAQCRAVAYGSDPLERYAIENLRSYICAPPHSLPLGVQPLIVGL